MESWKCYLYVICMYVCTYCKHAYMCIPCAGILFMTSLALLIFGFLYVYYTSTYNYQDRLKSGQQVIIELFH